MARNKTLLYRHYSKIQNRYEALEGLKKFEGKNKHAKILMQLNKEFDKTFRTLDYIIFREYENRINKIEVNPNQLTIYDLGA